MKFCNCNFLFFCQIILSSNFFQHSFSEIFFGFFFTSQALRSSFSPLYVQICNLYIIFLGMIVLFLT